MPVGIANRYPELRKHFQGQPEPRHHFFSLLRESMTSTGDLPRFRACPDARAMLRSIWKPWSILTLNNKEKEVDDVFGLS